ncbi:iron ABC transporter permease [Vagococcus penaei]|uniref:Iron ABC transporter permease n=1 Tax=Vagococcus penaei TaxID=633807 RepID=A0A1Q2D8K9_9ENTE|nr:iron chelate uptake ABC transporter family permease subunit [Vagococcus penaei]AQP54778.1 iron ABC transporter permease [Vagococcus penaei]RSU07586.1 iron ABC transporter permease [Vagococcus penaei]
MKYLSVINKICLLSLVTLGVLILFLTYQTYGNWEFALFLRGKKLLAFLIVGILTSCATISFQTLTHNQFLTPSILGFDSLYVLIQTVLYFFFGTVTGLIVTHKGLFFFSNVSLMVAISVMLFTFLLKKGQHDLFLLLMVGMILGTLFRSLSTFLQVAMDPNEYDKLQGKLFASFNNIDVTLLVYLVPVVILILLLYLLLATRLDVLHLGVEQAINLGIHVPRLRLFLLILISVSVAISTALVGPITFLGFIVANVTYRWLGTYRHRALFIGSSLISIFLLVCGQFLVEHVFQMNTTLSVVIEFSGGLYFVWKIIKERGVS